MELYDSHLMMRRSFCPQNTQFVGELRVESAEPMAVAKVFNSIDDHVEELRRNHVLVVTAPAKAPGDLCASLKGTASITSTHPGREDDLNRGPEFRGG